MKTSLILIISVLFVGCATHRTDSTERGRMGESEQISSAEQQRPMPRMSHEEMMQKIKQAATPSAAHAALQPLAGRWRTEAKMWMEPNSKPEVSTGTASAQWILGKRFLKEEYSGKFNNEPFQGTGLLGYDNVKKEYVSTWADSMGTGLMTGDGSYNAETRTFEMTGRFSCPLTEGERTARMLTRINDDNSHTLEMYGTTPEGAEFKTLEIVYKRIK